MMSGHHMAPHDEGAASTAAGPSPPCMHVCEGAQVHMRWGSLPMQAALVSASSWYEPPGCCCCSHVQARP